MVPVGVRGFYPLRDPSPAPKFSKPQSAIGARRGAGGGTMEMFEGRCHVCGYPVISDGSTPRHNPGVCRPAQCGACGEDLLQVGSEPGVYAHAVAADCDDMW